MGAVLPRVVPLLLAGLAGAASAQVPSPWGPADRIGAMNNLDPATTRAAARLVTTGKVYALGVVTGPQTPVWPGRSFKLVITPGEGGSGKPLGTNQVTVHDDVLLTHVGIGTQIDGFAHIGRNFTHYNGVSAAELFAPDGVKVFGTETIPPAATRGVLLDMTKVAGPPRPGLAYGPAQLQAAARAAGLSIGKGDVVILHTGWMAAMAGKDPGAFIAGQPGLGIEGAKWLAAQGVAMIGSDTAALEAIPFEDPATPFPVHQYLLVDAGIHILENLVTDALAKDGATAFLFVLGTPRLAGTVQAIVNPVAIR